MFIREKGVYICTFFVFLVISFLVRDVKRKGFFWNESGGRW